MTTIEEREYKERLLKLHNQFIADGHTEEQWRKLCDEMLEDYKKLALPGETEE